MVDKPSKVVSPFQSKTQLNDVEKAKLRDSQSKEKEALEDIKVQDELINQDLNVAEEKLVETQPKTDEQKAQQLSETKIVSAQ